MKKKLGKLKKKSNFEKKNLKKKPKKKGKSKREKLKKKRRGRITVDYCCNSQ
jgi:hypothetical protein